MGKALKLVNKLNRRAKSVKSRAGGFDRYDKNSRSEETMAKSPKAYQLERKIQRRLDRNFGIDMVRQEPKVSKRVKASTMERFDYGGSDYGIRATFAAGLIADIGLRPGDLVRVLHGSLKGLYLKVIAITDSTHARLEDSLLLSYAGAKEKTQVQALADTAGSLDATYFLLKSAADATSYYVWMDVDAGGNDPAPGGTGIAVSISSNDSAAVVAAAIAAAVGALAAFDASASLDKVTITNAAVGTTTDAADVDTGFTISVLTQGANANLTLSESNIHSRFQLSDVKSSYK